jgi:hypothetical protein
MAVACRRNLRLDGGPRTLTVVRMGGKIVTIWPVDDVL